MVVRLVRDHHAQPAGVRPQRGGHDDEGDAREAGSEGDRGPIAGAQAHATHAFDDGQLAAMAAESPAPNHQGREAEERDGRETATPTPSAAATGDGLAGKRVPADGLLRIVIMAGPEWSPSIRGPLQT